MISKGSALRHTSRATFLARQISSTTFPQLLPPSSPRLGMSPSALSDPPAYLSDTKFNRRITCPRTHLPVSFSDTGDPQGVPLLWILPSGCSRWFAAPQDPLANLFGVRLIAVDRPGVGATPVVPLEDRIRISCCELPRPCSPELTAVLIASVLEHLEVKLAHLLATSAGI